MYFEAILVISILVIFVIVARRLPDVFVNQNSGNTPGNTLLEKEKTLKPVFHLPKISFKMPRINLPSPKPVVEKRAETSNVATAGDSDKREASSVLSEENLIIEADNYLAQGKLAEAERAFLRIVAKNPKNPKLYNRLGAIYLKQRNYADSIEAFEAARDLDPQRASRHYNVALAAWYTKDLARARKAINQAIELAPDVEKYIQLKKLIDEM